LKRTVFLATPTANRELDVLGWESLANAEADSATFEFNLMGNAYSGMSGDVAGSRNALISIFLQTPATDLFFIDSDIGWEKGDFGKLVTAPVDFVAGTYRVKSPNMELFFHLPNDFNPKDIDKETGLIPTSFAPMGFTRISRTAIEKLIKAYPDEWYMDANLNIPRIHNLFEFKLDKLTRNRYTEDKTFCQKWREIGGKMWIHPDVSLSHVGKVVYRGRLADHIKEE
jgi:hypothetical protein